uniref:FLYWCH-type domain-containing protein n=1 Tax=Schizaphis graminum TaxID=13262 RepID=A0A2S2NXW4_SCHGA
MSNIEYISTQRKGECLIFNNCYFRIDKKIKNKKYWKYIENCGARVIISDEFTVHSDKFCNHNHSPCSVKIEEKRFKAKLRLRAKENPLKPIPKVIIKKIYNKYVKLEQRICSLKERVTSDPLQMKWINYLDNISYLIKHNE